VRARKAGSSRRDAGDHAPLLCVPWEGEDKSEISGRFRVSTLWNTSRERFQAQARAGGQAARQAVLCTWQGARTTAEKTVLIGGALGIISFFLPWYSIFLFQGSGLALAQNGKPSLWFFPIAMATALFLSWLHLHSDARKRMLAARWLIAIGAAWTWHWLNLLISSEANIGFGGFLAAPASILVLIGGFMQVGQRLDSSAKLITGATPTRCPRCSASVQPGNAFCDSCGNKLEMLPR
jgi:hypothetical protein